MDKKGFTLLEIIIVLGILGTIIFFTLSIFISPKVGEKLLLDQYIHMVANDIIYAKEYAITNNENVVFMVDTINNSYRAYRGNFVILEKFLPDDYEIAAVFGSGGSIYTSFQITNLGNVNRFGNITIKDQYGNRRKLTTTIRTGRVKVEVDD